MNNVKFHLGQLRHLYSLMHKGQVSDTAMAAEGLLSPAIQEFEKFEILHEAMRLELEKVANEYYLSHRAWPDHLLKMVYPE